jgi:alkylhydroperoxidase family enzyme
LAEQGVTEDMYAHVAEHDHPGYSEGERLAVEYAERFALDHLNLDDAFFEQLHEHFSDAEILDLTICIADFLGFGRVTQVLKLDQECSLDPSAPGGQRGGSR